MTKTLEAQANGQPKRRSLKMSEKYRSTIIAIVSFIVFWFVIILFCLPQTYYDAEDWRPSVRWNPDGNSDESLKPYPEAHVQSNFNRQFSFQPPRSQKFMRYFQLNPRDYKVADILMHQFNPSFNDSNFNFSVIDQHSHELFTRQLASATSLTDQFVKLEGDKLFAFNLLASNRVGAFRQIPDTRHSKCLTENGTKHQKELHLKASIIICYYNEAPSALLRTINTVLQRSPQQLIEEVLVVDDFSATEYRFDKIEPYIKSELVSAVRTPRREGLIRARLFGAKLTRGDVLVFLDSHVEANVGWLEPLIELIQANKSSIGCPIIDLINPETLIYTAAPMVRGGLKWNLNFKWDSVPSSLLKTYDDFVKPIESPTMAGGLFAIHRHFFYHLGSYDPGMELWGGENIELSLRTWMCGGQILILPCSRLGHIFRKKRPYGPEPNQPDSLMFNSRRAAEVWLDEYLYKFFEANPEAKEVEIGDLSDRIALRKRLECNNFTWFLDNVYPDLKSDLANDGPQLELTGSSMQPNLFSSMPRREGHAQTKRRRLRQVAQRDNQRLFRSRGGHSDRVSLSRPRAISRFQIQVSNSDLCIESRGGLLAKRFARLVLNKCAKLEGSEDVLGNGTNLQDQIWTETELHDLRLGENQCLDLVKNLPLLRQCHNMGSFQKWSCDNRSSNANIYNIGGGLCLGVERIQVGEPIIVTICDTQMEKSGVDDNRLELNNRFRDGHFASWQSAAMINRRQQLMIQSRKFKIANPLRPLNKWNLVPIHNYTREVHVHGFLDTIEATTR